MLNLMAVTLALPAAIGPASRFEAAASNREDLYRVKAIASGKRYKPLANQDAGK